MRLRSQTLECRDRLEIPTGTTSLGGTMGGGYRHEETSSLNYKGDPEGQPFYLPRRATPCWLGLAFCRIPSTACHSIIMRQESEMTPLLGLLIKIPVHILFLPGSWGSTMSPGPY